MATKRHSNSNTKLYIVGADVSNDTRAAGAGDVFRDIGPDGPHMRSVAFLGTRTSVMVDFLIPLDSRDWPRHTFPARIIRAINLFERFDIDSCRLIHKRHMPLFLAEVYRRLQCLRMRRLTTSLIRLKDDFAANLYEEAESEVAKAIELLNMSPTQRREYRMLPRYFCKHLGKACIAWNKQQPVVGLPRMGVSLQPCVAR